MWRVGCDQTEVRAGIRQFRYLAGDHFDETGPIVSKNEVEFALEIDTVNQELRVAAVAGLFAIKGDDRLVIIDRAFRSHPANDSKRFHCDVDLSLMKISTWETMINGTRNVGSRLRGNVRKAAIDCGSARPNRSALKTT